MKRDILIWRILDDDLVGTYHTPAAVPTGGHESICCSGVLLVNPGPGPRAGNSDLYVHIADRLASRGIPVFRFDLPGLGDSSGLIPLEIYAYWQEILQGRNDAATLALVDKIKQQFGLSNVIVGGLCAATVPTLRVANHYAGAIAGVILMEPAFSIIRENNTGNPQAGGVSALSVRVITKLRRIFSLRDWRIFLAGDRRIALMLRPLLSRIHQRLVGHMLPIDMNVPLFLQWRGSLARGTPSFVVVAAGLGNDRYVDLAIESLPASAAENITLIRVPQTNHILTSGRARDIVLDEIERWMVNNFSSGGV